MSDPYMEARRELDQAKKLFLKLHMKKEQEIALRRVGKRLCASDIKEMRELEGTIEGLFDRPRTTANAQQRSLLENVKNQYRASMRSWKNRLRFAEQYRLKRRKIRLNATGAAQP
ncbi:MAG: hypothetical protein AB1640_08350 [bacterium]